MAQVAPADPVGSVDSVGPLLSVVSFGTGGRSQKQQSQSDVGVVLNCGIEVLLEELDVELLVEDVVVERSVRCLCLLRRRLCVWRR